MADETNAEGYKNIVCIECELSSKSGRNKFQSYPIIVVGEPDCS